MLCFESNLTAREEKARDTMVYLFNPVLKMIFLETNPDEFRKYGFNSCRQTAILGAGYLRKLLPDYEISVYEGNFIEVINGIPTPYVHAYILANKDERHLLIDLSRTSKLLLFRHIVESSVYPTVGDYKDMSLISSKKLDLDSLLNTDCPEFYTEMIPRNLMKTIEILINDLRLVPEDKRLQFCDTIYKQTTELRR